MSSMRVVLTVAGLTVACAPPGASGAPVATARCGSPETPSLQGGDHLIGDRQPPVPYSSTPPTSGWHSSGSFEIAVQPPDDPLTEAEQVSVLEAGGVVVTYNGIGGDDLPSLQSRVSQQYAGRVAVTSYGRLGSGEVAFTGWGVLQRCDGLDLPALDGFVAAYADDQPAKPGQQ